eukprot:TRINITY_DN3786_c0_g1_i1.p1 TRINITY_DN3786_c0_g1~~TRINITY_DN3786_c0_g1_i1.p1  ORF type:complete len:156 (+),score=19.13 TRINITY_DN3786_c0_g1_i1:485-952(+)
MLNIDVIELARQLTLIRWNMYDNLVTCEFIGAKWNNDEESEKAYPNILQVIKFSKHNANWVATEILSRESKEEAAQVISYFIQLCNQCIRINNFDGAMDIYIGLQMNPIHRLVQTWYLVSPKSVKTYQQIQKLFLHHQNWSNYRARIEKTKSPAV